MKVILQATVIYSAFLISGCSMMTTSTSDLNMHHLRAVDITSYDTSIIATFCGTKEFNQLLINEPYPQVYTVLKSTKNYLDFKSSSINKFDPVKYEMWIGEVELDQYPEYKNCGHGKTYPYIYWFDLNVESTPPYKESRKEDYMKAYNEFKQQIIDTHQIELGIVQLSGFNGDDLISEKTSLLKLNKEQYTTVLDRMNYFEKHKRSEMSNWD